MKKIFYAAGLTLAYIFCGFGALLSQSGQAKVRGAIFDTQIRASESFAPAKLLASEQGMELEYIGMDKIMDWKLDKLLEAAGQVAFFQMSPEFFRGWQKSAGPACSKFLKLLKAIGQKKETLVALMLPSVGKDADQRVAAFQPLVKLSGLDDFDVDFSQTQKLREFLDKPLEQRKPPFHTVLTPPAAQFKKDYADKSLSGCALPVHKPKMSVLMDFFYPLAVHLKSDEKTVLVSSSALLGLAGPTENFQLMPVAENLANDFMVVLSQFFHEVRGLATRTRVDAPIKAGQVRKFKKVFEVAGLAKDGQPEAVDKKSFNKVSWMELDDFVGQSPEQEKYAAKLVEKTLDAGLDWVWISLSPNTLLSDNAINKVRANAVMAGLEKFAHMLVSRADERGQEVPKFLLGFELGNNIVEANAPKNFAHDIYGNPYPDMPEPLDFGFWKDELLKPLKTFMDRWARTEASKCLPVEGVVLDIEFYNRQWTSMFLPTMGFGKVTREHFALRGGEKRAGKMETDEFIKKMASQSRMGQYFEFLEKNAADLGQKLRTQVSKLLPGKTLCVYLPNLTLDWFHDGFFRGLSTQNQPIHIFSFNARFDCLDDMMAKKGIHTSHSAAVMLSKVNSFEEFGAVSQLAEQNRASSAPGQTGGIWLNRFSRIVHPFQPGQWFFLEQSSANQVRRDKFCRFLSEI